MNQISQVIVPVEYHKDEFRHIINSKQVSSKGTQIKINARKAFFKGIYEAKATIQQEKHFQAEN